MDIYIYAAAVALIAITFGPLAWGFVRGLNGFVRKPEMQPNVESEVVECPIQRSSDEYWDRYFLGIEK
jgi:hypothetical protein